MSYTNETTHYGIPLPLGTDLTTPMDYNQSAQSIDTALFGAVTDASAGVQKANAVEEALGTTNDNLSALTGRVTSAEGTITTQGNAITQLQLDVADTKADALDMICAVDEGTAQVASVKVDKGQFFRYNDVLYIATDDIAVGNTIVPNTNCRATNVATELENLNNAQKSTHDIMINGTKYGTVTVVNGIAVLNCNFPNSVPSSDTVLYTLPEGFRPSEQLYFTGRGVASGNAVMVNTQIFPNGAIVAYTVTEGDVLNAVYPVA